MASALFHIDFPDGAYSVMDRICREMKGEAGFCPENHLRRQSDYNA